MSMERFNDLIKTNKKGSLTNSIIGPLISSEQLKLKWRKGRICTFSQKSTTLLVDKTRFNFSIMVSPASSPGHNHVEATNPNLPSDPITNPLTNSLGTTLIMRPPWFPSKSTGLKWTRLDGYGPFITNGRFQEVQGTTSEQDSESVTTQLFNLDSLNEQHLETMHGVTWNVGCILESPDSLVESLVQRVNIGRF